MKHIHFQAYPTGKGTYVGKFTAHDGDVEAFQNDVGRGFIMTFVGADWDEKRQCYDVTVEFKPAKLFAVLADDSEFRPTRWQRICAWFRRKAMKP